MCRRESLKKVQSVRLGEMLHLYRIAKYRNGTPLETPNTFTASIENMLMEVYLLSYTGKNDQDYKIKYEEEN